MNEASVGQYVNSYVFSVGRRVLTMQQIAITAADAGDATIAAQAQAAIAHDHQTWQRTRQWERARKQTQGARVDALEIDRAVDRALTGCLRIANGFLHSMTPGDPQYDISLAFVNEFFPDGAQPITQLPFEEELLAAETMVNAWQGPWAARITQLGLHPLATRTATLLLQYRDAIVTVAQRDITWDEVRTADRAGQENMLRLVARVLGTHNTDSPDDVQWRARYLKTFDDQNQRIAAYRRRSAVVPDINPSTGEELTDAEWATDALQPTEPAEP